MPDRRLTRSGLLLVCVCVPIGCTLLGPSDEDLVGGGATGGKAASGGSDASVGGKGGSGGTTGGGGSGAAPGGSGGTPTGGSGGTPTGGGGIAGSTGGGGVGGTTTGGGTGGVAGGSTGGVGGNTGGTGGSTGGTGGTGGSPTIPTNGLVLWLDATAGVTAPGGAVSNWADQSPAKNDATQFVAGARPNLATVDGKPGVQFDGNDDYLSLPSGFPDFTQGLVAYAVVRFEADGICPPIFQLSNGGEVDDISFQRETSGTLLYEVGSDAVSTPGPVLPLATTVLASVRQGVNGGTVISTNGVANAAATVLTPVTITRLINTIGIGQYSSCTPMQGEIFELLLYSRDLLNSEQASVVSYLKTKWACCT